MDEKAVWELALRDRWGIDSIADREFIDELWERLEGDRGPAGQLCETRAEFLEELLKTAEGYCKSYRLGRERGGAAGIGGRPPGTDKEKDLGGQLPLGLRSKSHLMALSEYLAKLAAVERRVMNFRRRSLGAATRTLTPAEVPQILESCSIPHVVFSFAVGWNAP